VGMVEGSKGFLIPWNRLKDCEVSPAKNVYATSGQRKIFAQTLGTTCMYMLCDGRGPSTSPHASPPKGRFGPTIELWPRGSKKTFFYICSNAINSSVE